MARDVLTTAFEALGRAVAPWLHAFDASLLVLGGSIAGSWDLVAPAVRAGLGGAAVKVAPSALGDDAPLIGAAAWLRRSSA